MNIKKNFIIFILLIKISVFANYAGENIINTEDDYSIERNNVFNEEPFRERLKKISRNRIVSNNKTRLKLKVSLSLSHLDIIIKKKDNYFEFYIRKKNKIESVLITTVPEQFKISSSWNYEYALRSMNYIKENKNNEILYKDKLIGFKQKLYFLASSNFINHNLFGKVFIIKVPLYVVYGYKWENFGTIRLNEGVKINIRTFAEKYANYKNGFADNIITIDRHTYSGDDDNPPQITLLDKIETNNRVTLIIKYTDNEKFYKGFYVKENNKDFKEIIFHSLNGADEFEDMKAILIKSTYDQIEKKVVIFKYYIEKKEKPRNLTIIGVDISGNKSIIPIVITISASGS